MDIRLNVNELLYVVLFMEEMTVLGTALVMSIMFALWACGIASIVYILKSFKILK